MGRLTLETSQRDGVSDEVPSKDDVSSKVSKQIHFVLSATSKFPAARDVVGQSGKQMIIRTTLAYGTKYGIGVFCWLETGEQQISWVPENDKTTLNFVEKAYSLPSFQVRFDRASCKK